MSAVQRICLVARMKKCAHPLLQMIFGNVVEKYLPLRRQSVLKMLISRLGSQELVSQEAEVMPMHLAFPTYKRLKIEIPKVTNAHSCLQTSIIFSIKSRIIFLSKKKFCVA